MEIILSEHINKDIIKEMLCWIVDNQETTIGRPKKGDFNLSNAIVITLFNNNELWLDDEVYLPFFKLKNIKSKIINGEVIYHYHEINKDIIKEMLCWILDNTKTTTSISTYGEKNTILIRLFNNRQLWLEKEEYMPFIIMYLRNKKLKELGI